jgi:hypothetical protein
LREAIDNASTESDGTDGDCDAGLGADTIVFAPDTVSGNGASRIFNVLGGVFDEPIDVTIDNRSGAVHGRGAIGERVPGPRHGHGGADRVGGRDQRHLHDRGGTARHRRAGLHAAERRPRLGRRRRRHDHAPGEDGGGAGGADSDPCTGR